MPKKWRLTDRTKMLLKLELAITLPALALMAFSIWNLKHIQRDQAIEAAIQRDLTSLLKFTEKKTWLKANDIVEPVRKAFPSPDENATKIKAQLDHILAEHPEFAYALLYDKKNNVMISRTQSGEGRDAQFCMRAQDNINSLSTWLPMEAPDMAEGLRKMDEPTGYYGGWMEKEDHHYYTNEAYFIPPGVDKERVSLGVVSFDQDYLQQKFFPAVLTDVLNSKYNAMHSDPNPPTMMIHIPKDPTPWVASSNWDGGKPEVERAFTEVFRGMIVAIKYNGTTIADLGAKFLRTNYITLAGLSLFMIGGIILTYRNISREMNLARLKSDFVANVSTNCARPSPSSASTRKPSSSAASPPKKNIRNTSASFARKVNASPRSSTIFSISPASKPAARNTSSKKPISPNSSAPRWIPIVSRSSRTVSLSKKISLAIFLQSTSTARPSPVRC